MYLAVQVYIRKTGDDPTILHLDSASFTLLRKHEYLVEKGAHYYLSGMIVKADTEYVYATR